MLSSIVRAVAARGLATLAYASTAVITSAPAAAQFAGAYALEDDDFPEYGPVRRGIEIDG